MSCCAVRSAWEWAWHLPQLAVKCQQRTTNEQKEAAEGSRESAVDGVRIPYSSGACWVCGAWELLECLPIYSASVFLSFVRFFRLAVCIWQSVKTLYLLSTHRLCSEGKVNRKLRFVVAEHIAEHIELSKLSEMSLNCLNLCCISFGSASSSARRVSDPHTPRGADSCWFPFALPPFPCLRLCLRLCWLATIATQFSWVQRSVCVIWQVLICPTLTPRLTHSVGYKQSVFKLCFKLRLQAKWFQGKPNRKTENNLYPDII